MHSVIEFSGDWKIKLHGMPQRGYWVNILYDSQRLPRIRDQKYGSPVWAIYMHVSFVDAHLRSFRLSPENTDGILAVSFQIPSDASHLRFWFQNWGYFSTSDYDSYFGRNFEFTI